MNMPYCKFFYRDWLADMPLRQCSPATRGIWADMLCLAGINESHHGFLDADGNAMTVSEIARLTCNKLEDVSMAIAELETKGVFSRNERGAIYCRRMVKDRERHLAKSKAANARWSKNLPFEQTGAHPSAHADVNAEAHAQPDASVHAQIPDNQSQKSKETETPTYSRNSGRIPANWPLMSAFSALTETGKFPQLTPELLALVDRNYPRAGLSENFSELVEAARCLPGTIGEPHGWLSKKASQIEVRLTRHESTQQTPRWRTAQRPRRIEMPATERARVL